MMTFDPAMMSREALIERVYELEMKLEAYQSLAEVSGENNLCEAFTLTNSEAKLLTILSDGRTHTKDAIMSHLYGGRDEPEMKIIDVFICKLRKKLRGSAVVVKTEWGRGYRVVDTEPLKAVMRGEPVPPAPEGDNDTRQGRPAGGWNRPHGVVRDAALAWLRNRANPDGIAHFLGRELERGIEARTPTSNMLQSLERGGYVSVIARPGRGPVKTNTYTYAVRVL